MKKDPEIPQPEDFDLTAFGFYYDRDPSVPEEDFFLTPYTAFGLQLWARFSDFGVKWDLYENFTMFLNKDSFPKKVKKTKKVKR
jgi:hypothetical protein